jgi:SSS family transporter
MLWLSGFCSVFMVPLGIWLFLRFFFMTRTFTAYEFLEQRYNVSVRLIGSLIYCLLRLVYAGVVFYAASRVFESLVGWPPFVTILAVGAFTIAYTTTGGMKAVMFTDVLQGSVLIVGIVAVLAKLLAMAGYDAGAIYTFAAQHGRGLGPALESKFYRFDFHDRFSFWLLLIGVMTVPLMHLSADQLVIQRLLASKSYADAKRAVLVKWGTGIPIVAMFWLVGIGLFYFYSTHPGRLGHGVEADHILGHFINHELPTPIPGLVVAALLAALMSTIDSTVNSIGNVVHRDWLVRLGAVVEGSRYELFLCRVLSAIAGLLGVGIAVSLTLGSEGIRSSIIEINAIWGCLWNVLLMAFILGVLVPRVSGPNMFVGMLVGGATNLALPYLLYYRVPADGRISFMWVGVPGMLIALLLPLLLSLIRPNTKDLSNLTVWTLRKPWAQTIRQSQDAR